MNWIKAACCAGLLAGCHALPERHPTYYDPQLAPFWQAMRAVNRDSLGFTPVQPSARIELEGKTNMYDAMLHIYGTTSRTVAFRQQGSGYVWIGEQETHTGPGKYTTVDGTFDEALTITFDKQLVSGAPLNQVQIEYRGPDSTVARWPDRLTLPDAARILGRWRRARAGSR